jgi:hypothetical protein
MTPHVPFRIENIQLYDISLLEYTVVPPVTLLTIAVQLGIVFELGILIAHVCKT